MFFKTFNIILANDAAVSAQAAIEQIQNVTSVAVAIVAASSLSVFTASPTSITVTSVVSIQLF